MQQFKIIITVIMLATGFVVRAAEQRSKNIHEAAKNNDVKGLQSFLAQDPQLIDHEGPFGETPLCSAVRAEQHAAVEHLLSLEDGRKTVNKRNVFKKLPLTYAIEQGSVKTMQSLLDAKADPNELQTPGGGNHLNLVLQNNDSQKRSEMASLLVLYGVPIICEDQYGNMHLYKVGVHQELHSVMLKAYVTRKKLLEEQAQQAFERQRNEYELLSASRQALDRENAQLKAQLQQRPEQAVLDDERSKYQSVLAAKQLVEQENAALRAQLIQLQLEKEQVVEEGKDREEWDFVVSS